MGPLALHLQSLALWPLKIEHRDGRGEHREVSHGAQWFHFQKIWLCRKIEENIRKFQWIQVLFLLKWHNMAICGYPTF